MIKTCTNCQAETRTSLQASINWLTRALSKTENDALLDHDDLEWTEPLMNGEEDLSAVAITLEEDYEVEEGTEDLHCQIDKELESASKVQFTARIRHIDVDRLPETFEKRVRRFNKIAFKEVLSVAKVERQVANLRKEFSQQ